MEDTVAVWTRKSWITNSRKIPRLEWVTFMWCSFVQSCLYFVTLDLHKQNCESIDWIYRTQVFSESVFSEHKIIFNVDYEYFMW